MSIRDRERLEKDRIDKDRAARERAEMQRRADWERMEDERRRLEEDELTRRRRLEKVCFNYRFSLIMSIFLQQLAFCAKLIFSLISPRFYTLLYDMSV